MSTYVFGDIQGCFEPFQCLLKKIDFNPDKDRLWSVGDLVNRGPGNIETLRWFYAHRDNVTMVLGNHDLHLMAVSCGARKPSRKDNLDDILDAPDREQLIEWLQPAFEVATPEWVCPPGGIEEQAAGCIRASGFPSIVYLAGVSAAFGVLVPWINRRWRIAGWVTLALFMIVRSIDGTSVPADGLVVVAFGPEPPGAPAVGMDSNDPRRCDLRVEEHGFSRRRQSGD